MDDYSEVNMSSEEENQFSKNNKNEIVQNKAFPLTKNNSKDYDAYIKFTKASIETLEKNLEIISDFKRFKNNMGKFLNGRNLESFNKFEDDFENVEREMQMLINRLKKSNFEIIFVGAEKAGKTTTICSWLACKGLLPSSVGRCTFTTLEILPSEDNEEKILTEYFNEAEFLEIKEYFLNQLHKIEKESNKTPVENESLMATDSDPKIVALKEELAAIEKCEKDPEFQALLRKKTDEKKFGKEDKKLKEYLHKTITHEIYSRAIKTVTFYTSLFLSKNASIYDLPGFDSPTSIHKNLAIKRCQTADCIVYLKEFIRPSLPLQEVTMLNTFKNCDQLIPFEEKLVLVLTGVDRCNNDDDKFNATQLAKKEWEKKYKLSSNRIAIVTNEYDINKQKLRSMGINDSGISNMDRLIEECKIQSHSKILKKKVTAININFSTLMKEFLQFSEKSFPYVENIDNDNSENSDFKLDQERAKATWWNSEFSKIHKKFSEYYQTIVGDRNENGIQTECFVSFKKKYSEMVDFMFERIRGNFTEEACRAIYNDQVESGNVLAPGAAHLAIRKKLSQEVYDNLASVLSVELSKSIWETISKMLDWILGELYGIKEIKEDLLHDTEKNAQRIIDQQIETLILRIARAAVELFTRYPRHDGRLQCMKRFSHEVLILDMFYRDEKSLEFESKGLDWFLITGNWDKTDNQTSLKLDLVKLEESVLSKYKDAFKITSNFDEALSQINNDIDVLQDYMKNSVYYGAGLEAFFLGELDKIKKRFKYFEEDGDSWRIRVFKEIDAGNPNIPFTQVKLEATEKYEIGKALKALSEKINKP